MNKAINAFGFMKIESTTHQWFPVGSLAFNTLGFQSVRWRKPMWLPKAPSKLYKITQRKKLPEDQSRELRRLYANHKCYLKMIQQHCVEENRIERESGQLSPQMLELEEEEHRRLMEYNRQENARIAALREQRLAKEFEELLISASRLKEEQERKLALERQTALARIEEAEELVKRFIAPEDFEETIERAIDSPVDYNFSVDESGRVYKGRTTQPHLVDQNTVPDLSVADPGRTNVF